MMVAKSHPQRRYSCHHLAVISLRLAAGCGCDLAPLATSSSLACMVCGKALHTSHNLGLHCRLQPEPCDGGMQPMDAEHHLNPGLELHPHYF